MTNPNCPGWLGALYGVGKRKPLPILSFPSASLMGVSVKELISSADLQARGMVEVAKRVDSAASVSLMDLSVEAECFGARVVFEENEVPNVVGRLIEDEEGADALEIPKVGDGRSGLCVEAVRLACEQITDRPVLAGIIGPFSLAARLLDVTEIMMDCYDEPDMVHTVLEKATAFLIEYARAFKAVGAAGVMMAEPVAGLLSPSLEEEFAAPYVKQIIDAVQDASFAVIYHNCGGNTPMMTESIYGLGAAGYHFGNAVDLKTMLDKAPEGTLVMGNVDPAGILRMGSVEDVTRETRRLMDACRDYPGFVPSSGCDIPPATPWENIDAFFAAVAEG